MTKKLYVINSPFPWNSPTIMPTKKILRKLQVGSDQNPVCLLWIRGSYYQFSRDYSYNDPYKPPSVLLRNVMSGFWTPCLIDSMLIRKFVNLYLELQSSRVHIQGLLFSQVCQVSTFGFAGCACRLPRAPWTRIAGFLGRSMMGLPSQDVVHTKGGSSQDL